LGLFGAVFHLLFYWGLAAIIDVTARKKGHTYPLYIP